MRKISQKLTRLCRSPQPEPIYMLVPTDIPGANSRISNLRQATADYVAEYNVCKCKPCQNGGTLTLLDGKCICMCPQVFEGLGCQNFKGDKTRAVGKRTQRTGNAIIIHPFCRLLSNLQPSM